MHASPAFLIRIHRFGLWRAAVAALVVLALAAQLAWLAAPHDDTPGWLLTLLAAPCAVLLGAACTHLRRAPVELRWDTQRWYVASPVASGREPPPGNLTIALDLGSWMLLRFEPDGAGRATWLPVQRRGLPGQWHALRCAVYCARSASGHVAGPNSSASPESQE